MNWVCHNGEMVPGGQPLFDAGNRSFRYGDGLFETMRVYKKELLLESLHFNRLFTGLQLLNIRPAAHFTPDVLQQNILQLCQINGCAHLARVRLAVYRTETGEAGYVIEAFAVGKDALQWNKDGWKLVVYGLARKSCDAFANLKSANYLPYVLAGAFAAGQGADEALVLNTYNHVADGSKTNIFLIKEKTIYTPALHQGCVSGVMRRHVIDNLKVMGYVLHQIEISEQLLLEADEVFCTNAVQGIRWVKSFAGKEYGNTLTRQIYKQLFAQQLL